MTTDEDLILVKCKDPVLIQVAVTADALLFELDLQLPRLKISDLSLDPGNLLVELLECILVRM